jgi:tRNA(Ile)-lysidine synthase
VARRALSAAGLALVQAVEAHLGDALAATPSDRIRVGLSGGADSLALAAAVAWAVQRAAGPLYGVAADAVVVDHGLQVRSGEVAARAAYQGCELGLPTTVVGVTVTRTAAGLEADARAARYAALLDDPDAVVAVAHTLDDQAETVLLGLARGSGTRSLAGMAIQDGRLVRPLLALRRRDTEQACRDWGLTPWQDPMNEDPRYTRTRARQALATLEGALGPGLTEALARTGNLCRVDADYLDDQADTVWRSMVEGGAGVPVATNVVGVSGAAGVPLATGAAGVPVATLAALPIALRDRVIVTWLRQAGATDIGLTHVQAVAGLVTDFHGQVGVDVPGGRASRRQGHLFFQPRTALSQLPQNGAVRPIGAD